LYLAYFIILYNGPTNAQLIDNVLYCSNMFHMYNIHNQSINIQTVYTATIQDFVRTVTTKIILAILL